MWIQIQLIFSGSTALGPDRNK
uniref:Uncharacterized protein n=1 Tax=Anguilla anguilla TaxID=7936 RepID=A0A0E9RVT9_ANGAN